MRQQLEYGEVEFWNDGGNSFICGVNGDFSISTLREIEESFKETDIKMFDKIYSIRCTPKYDAADPESGMSPYWYFENIKYAVEEWVSEKDMVGYTTKE